VTVSVAPARASNVGFVDGLEGNRRHTGYAAPKGQPGDAARDYSVGRRIVAEVANLAAALRELERDGLVVRTPDAEDRRKVRVRLTQTGRETLYENITRREQWLAEAIEQSLTKEERALLFKAGELFDRVAAYRGAAKTGGTSRFVR
jgi:DNA-binding PadR family transcriptional regulator